MNIIECNDVRKSFTVERGYTRAKVGTVKAADGVSFHIERGETYGLVGESGSGKTTLGKMILGIIPPNSGEVVRHTSKMQAIFQDPHNSLDPKMKVSEILAEGLIIKKERRDIIERKVWEVLELVNLPRISLKKYPHQFSGGERQRIAIGRAVLTDPEFIVCDEPVSSLDVTIQVQILKLLKEIQRRLSISYLFISHDLRAVKFMADRIAVMKDGRIVEEGPSQKISSSPSHPYTKLLLSSILEVYPK
jgi:ABC-type glutathione transport system ATPase component